MLSQIKTSLTQLWYKWNTVDGVHLPSSALYDAYEIHGDGQARMIPGRLVEREQFQNNLELIDQMSLTTTRTTENPNMNIILPYFKDTDGNTWEVLSMNWCIDFGGRQCQIECQRNNGDGTFPSKTFVIHGLTGEFKQWNSTEVGNSTPEANSQFLRCVMGMFRAFDESTDPAFKVPVAPQ